MTTEDILDPPSLDVVFLVPELYAQLLLALLRLVHEYCFYCLRRRSFTDTIQSSYPYNYNQMGICVAVSFSKACTPVLLSKGQDLLMLVNHETQYYLISMNHTGSGSQVQHDA